MAYDVTLEIVDYLDGDCLQKLVVRSDIYTEFEAERLSGCYERLLKAFIADPSISLDRPELFDPVEVEESIGFSQGKYASAQLPHYPQTEKI
jgi:hybrid polyketide synthase / nonribosomal peptide synthetase ACE1